ncbi:hypothetical protein DAPPUDRAFT_304312 [Daphnia pulex]|uniref:Uncharacterized protein n=1 Tax=Daphnia pulex TaxID=6669 RepID=E9GL64_DAPPU|nr:hypothetical protein DAPPUDRAFT_304312 [Daphnia pulex]|eukprot:EFX79799.1 hypothetical protein DAPPUDRAFT_304312 [Daphnia pulex]
MLSAHRTVAGIEFLQIFFFSLSLSLALSLSFYHPRFALIIFPLITQSKTIAMLCAFLSFFIFSRIIIDNIVDIVLLSLSLCRNSLLDNMGKQFCGCECGLFFYFYFFSHVGKHNHTHKAHSLQCPPSHLPLFANVQ